MSNIIDDEKAAYSDMPRTMTFLDELAREKLLLLKPKSWRIFVDNASAETIEAAFIEVVCTWSRSLMVDPIRVGKLREALDEIPITVKIHCATDSWINALKADNAIRKENQTDGRKRTEFAGLLEYCEPMNSGGGVVNDKHGSVNALFAMGSDSFYFFRSIITRSNTPDFSIGLTVRLPGKDLEWDGKGQIDVVSGRLVLVTNEGDEADAKAIEISPDPTALQLAVSKDIAANLNKMRITVIWAAIAIVLTIAMFH